MLIAKSKHVFCNVAGAQRERERARWGAQPVDHSTVNHPVPPRNPPYASYNVLYRDICILPTNC